MRQGVPGTLLTQGGQQRLSRARSNYVRAVPQGRHRSSTTSNWEASGQQDGRTYGGGGSRPKPLKAAPNKLPP